MILRYKGRTLQTNRITPKLVRNLLQMDRLTEKIQQAQKELFDAYRQGLEGAKPAAKLRAKLKRLEARKDLNEKVHSSSEL